MSWTLLYLESSTSPETKDFDCFLPFFLLLKRHLRVGRLQLPGTRHVSPRSTSNTLAAGDLPRLLDRPRDRLGDDDMATRATVDEARVVHIRSRAAPLSLIKGYTPVLV